MRIPILSAALALLTAVPAAAQEVRGIVFAAQQFEDGSGFIEPAFLVSEYGLIAPVWELSDSVVAAFEARWLREGRRYGLYKRGVPAGSAQVITPQAAACEGAGATAAFTGERRLPAEWSGLAVEGLPAQAGAPWLREVTAAERGALDRLAAALFAAHGIDDLPERESVDTMRAALLFRANARPVLVASYEAGGGSGTAAMLIIAEERQAGYRPAYAWFHHGIEAQVETRELVDALDVDGDGMPELVVRNGFYEDWTYSVLSRTPEGWIDIYTGGANGC